MATIVLMACSSATTNHYKPKPYPYLRQVQHSGKMYWEGGGKRVERGYTWAGLDTVVAEVPGAKKRAQEAQNHISNALIWSLVTVGGALPFAHGAAQSLGQAPLSRESKSALVVGGIVYFVGILAGRHQLAEARAAMKEVTYMFNDYMWEKHLLRRHGASAVSIPAHATPATPTGALAKP
jgi:hypothetical protein